MPKLRVVVCLLLCLPAFARADGESEEDAAVSFAVVGHVRPNDGQEVTPLLGEVLARLRTNDPDLLLLTGDLIWGDYDRTPVERTRIVQQWEHLDRRLATLDLEVHRVPGNHDINDPVTRDVFNERYGVLPRAFDRGRCRFILLNSCWTPEGDGPALQDRLFVRGKDLGGDQIQFLRQHLERLDDVDHVFVFLHHLLWWKQDAAWWADVHPLLVDRKVRAVFGGDLGPLKFSQEERDGVQYIQTAIEGTVPSTGILAELESARLLNFQFDNIVLVSVRGASVDFRVEQVGALTSGKTSPRLWHEIESYPVPLRVKISRLLGSGRRQTFLAATAVGLVLSGFLLGFWVRARRMGSAKLEDAHGP